MAFPRIHFGVYEIPLEQTVDAVEIALECGYRGVDSARAYGNEAGAVQGLTNFWKKHPELSRDNLYYTTKVAAKDFGYDKTRAAVKQSAQIAGSFGIDLVLMHSSHGGPHVRAETWKALEDCKKEGLVSNIGVSNWGVQHLKDLAKVQRVKPLVNQIELNPWLQHRDIVEYCHGNDIIVEAWSPLTRGLRIDDPEVAALAKKYGRTPAQILLRWAIQYGTVPIPKSVTPSRIEENLDVFDFELTDEDFKNLGSPTDYYVTSPQWDPTVLD